MITEYFVKKEDLMPNPERVRVTLTENILPSLVRKVHNDELFTDTLAELCTTFLHRLEPVCLTKAVPVEYFRDVFGESLPASSPIYKAADRWRTASTFVATIGPFTEMSIGSLQERGDFYRAAFLDALASELVEQVVENMQQQWAFSARKVIPMQWDLYPARYSPGYCGWDARGLVALFGYMADVNLPVSLLTDYRMHPIKSVSGVLVIEEEEAGSEFQAACRVCPQKCNYVRKIKEHSKIEVPK